MDLIEILHFGEISEARTCAAAVEVNDYLGKPVFLCIDFFRNYPMNTSCPKERATCVPLANSWENYSGETFLVM